MVVLVLEAIKQDFSVCKVPELSEVDFTDEFCFVGKTDEELSLVCSTKCVPETATERDDGWKAFRIRGPLDFSMIGVLSKIAGILADAGIGIFAVSTYNTDYILTKKDKFELTLSLLESAGYDVIR